MLREFRNEQDIFYFKNLYFFPNITSLNISLWIFANASSVVWCRCCRYPRSMYEQELCSTRRVNTRTRRSRELGINIIIRVCPPSLHPYVSRPLFVCKILSSLRYTFVCIHAVHSSLHRYLWKSVQKSIFFTPVIRSLISTISPTRVSKPK